MLEPDSILTGVTLSVPSQDPDVLVSTRNLLVVGRVDVHERPVLEDGLRLASRRAAALRHVRRPEKETRGVERALKQRYTR